MYKIFKLFEVLIILISSLHTVHAQKTEITQTVDSSSVDYRFSVGAGFGTGNAMVHRFQSLSVRDYGYSNITGMIVFNFDLGYALSEKYSLFSGSQVQSLGLLFVFEDESFRYHGERFTIPLSFRRYFNIDPSPMRPFLGFGVYYSFTKDEPLLSDAGFEVYNPFNTFGLSTHIGFEYWLNRRSGINFSYNAQGDLSGNFLRANTSFFTLGYQSYLF